MINHFNDFMGSPYLNPQFNRFAQKMEIIKVNGRNGADAFQMQPNSSALLLDEREPIVWLKTTDGAGYATIIPYTITPYEPQKPIDTNDLDARLSRLEKIVNEQSNIITTNGNTNDASDKSDETGNANAKKCK